MTSRASISVQWEVEVLFLHQISDKQSEMSLYIMKYTCSPLESRFYCDTSCRLRNFDVKSWCSQPGTITCLSAPNWVTRHVGPPCALIRSQYGSAPVRSKLQPRQWTNRRMFRIKRSPLGVFKSPLLYSPSSLLHLTTGSQYSTFERLHPRTATLAKAQNYHGTLQSPRCRSLPWLRSPTHVEVRFQARLPCSCGCCWDPKCK